MSKNIPLELEALIQKEYANIASIVVIKNGTTILEHYFNGYTQQDRIHIASVTKSVLSMLVGIAIDKGYIESVNQKVLDFFPHYIIKKREKTIQQVTIRHLLTMTAPFKFRSEPYTRVYSSDDWTTSVLDLLGGKTLKEEFKYTIIGLQVLSGILTTATGASLSAFAAEHLFSPLGIQQPENVPIHNKEEYMAFLKDKPVSGWVSDPQGVNTAGWGLALTTMDIAKLGLLYLNKGIWSNIQIVSSEWIEMSTKMHSQCNDLSYGYLWWIIEDNKCFAAIGDGGNIVYVDNELNVVVAIASTFMPRAKDRIKFIKRYIIPMAV